LDNECKGCKICADFQIKIGSIILAIKCGSYWIMQLDGEGMEVDMHEMERMLQDYYSGNF